MAFDDPSDKYQRSNQQHPNPPSEFSDNLTTQDGFYTPSSTSASTHNRIFTPQTTSSYAHSQPQSASHHGVPAAAPPPYTSTPVHSDSGTPRLNLPPTPQFSAAKPAGGSSGPPYAPAPPRQHNQDYSRDQDHNRYQNYDRSQDSNRDYERGLHDQYDRSLYERPNDRSPLAPRRGRRHDQDRAVRAVRSRAAATGCWSFCAALCGMCLLIPTAIVAAIVGVFSALIPHGQAPSLN